MPIDMDMSLMRTRWHRWKLWTPKRRASCAANVRAAIRGARASCRNFFRWSDVP